MADSPIIFSFDQQSGLLASNPVQYYQFQATSLDWFQAISGFVSAGMSLWQQPTPAGAVIAASTLGSTAGSIVTVGQDIGHVTGFTSQYGSYQAANAIELGMIGARENPMAYVPGTQFGNDFNPLQPFNDPFSPINSDWTFNGG